MNPPPPDNISEKSSTTGRETSDEDWTDSDSDSDSEESYLEEDLPKGPSPDQGSGDFLINPNWIFDQELGRGAPDFLKPAEEDFWKRFIAKYLLPIDKDVNKEVLVLYLFIYLLIQADSSDF